MINPVYPTLITGSITGCRVSNVASYYFLDNLPAAVLQFAGSGDAMHIYDDAGKIKKVTLGARGTGQTLDGNLITDPGFADAGSWIVGSRWAVAGNIATGIDTTGNLTSTAGAAVSGVLYRSVWDLVSITGGTAAYRLAGQVSAAGVSTPGTNTQYLTAIASGPGAVHTIIGKTSFSGTVDNFQVNKVTAPSSSGIWYTPVSEESGWNPNAATHTYRILARRIVSGNGGYYK